MSSSSRSGLIAAAALGLAIALLGILRVGSVSGVVLDEDLHPIQGAVVRIRATDHWTGTDSQGKFELTGFPPALRVRVTAWSDGYYIAGRSVWPWDREVKLILSAYAAPDNTDYEWIPPAVEQRSAWEDLEIRARLDPSAALAPDAWFFKAAEGLALGCRDCHGQVIYDQWQAGAHSLGFANPRYASMYNGTDISGEHQSPPTRYGVSRDYGRVPLLPDPSRPYFGPGYKLDFPETAGNCATCHVPSAALADPYGIDPNAVAGVDAMGSHCDFCHKVAGVRLDPATGLPFENMPGVLSLVMMRPAPDRQIFFGPYDDVDAGTDTYLPLQRESQYCAACHTASFWGVPIYQSFAEWLASPYSDPQTGKTCQDCHMKPDGETTNFAPGRAGQERDPEEVFTHVFPGAGDPDLLQNAVSLSAVASRVDETLVVQVRIVNDQTGHHVPTDSPLRQMILLVEARDEDGTLLKLLRGPTLPEAAGEGDPNLGFYAGRPGRLFARTLQELWTEVSPTGAYWNPTRLLSDTRLAALAEDVSRYTFADASDRKITVRVRLIFRRAFIELMQQKGWDLPDTSMEVWEQIVD
ncbi:MAG TPA: carboxypeptidase regulatory-like domain-containing protein [Anaerolineales bacterium]|nr:carboxypeptidase regulatory-like domain-containing protein [Anaerolineales bacterium]